MVKTKQALSSIRRGQQVKVVANQHVGMKRYPKLHCVFAQKLKQHLVIRIGSKYNLAVVTPLNHMVRVAGQGEAGGYARYGGRTGP